MSRPVICAIGLKYNLQRAPSLRDS
jgi:hypothetical protein